MPESPRATVVVPTYNRSALLRATLGALADQRGAAPPFEVVVADDGSTDDTPAVVKEFADRLPLRYHFQDDLGFRAGAARNAGARLASAPVLIFLDTGVLPGPGFVAAHCAAHNRPNRAVIGYTYGYRPGSPTPGLAEALRTRTPQEVVDFYGGDPAFADVRHPTFAALRFDLGRSLLPWQLFWSVNVSARTDDFRAAGGFDEDFRSWGGEDLELGFRLARHGLRFAADADAWAVDTPHPRDHPEDSTSNRGNMLLFLTKHPEPVVELLWAWFMRDQPWYEGTHSWHIDGEWLRVLRAAAKARAVDVTPELETLRDLPTDARIAIIGCGGALPAGLPPAELIDFDRELLDRLPPDPRHRTHHAIGIRTVLPDDSVDVVFISSRLRGLWDRWAPNILAEARRVGGSVRGPFG